MNLHKDIDPGTKEEMNVVIETPRGTRNKYELDIKTGIIWLDRVIPGAHDYPVEYGMVPQTLWDDGDALDVILLSSFPFLPGIVVPVRPVGLLDMIDGGESDAKVLGVPTGDPRFAHVKELSDVNPHTLKEIAHFFTTYKQLGNKEVIVNGFKDRKAAEAAFERARKMYEEKRMDNNVPAEFKKKDASYGALLSIIVILAIVVVGAFYSWGKRIEENTPPPIPDETSTTETGV